MRFHIGRVGSETHRFERLRQTLAESAALISDPDALRTVIASRFHEATQPSAVVLCELAADGSVVSGVASQPGRDHTSVRFSTKGRLIRWLETNECGVTPADQEEVYQYIDHDERAVLAGNQVRCCLPVMGVDRLVGLLCFIDSDADWRLSDPVRALQCARQAGLTLEAIMRQRRQYENLRTLHRAQQLVVAGQLAAMVAHEVRNPLAAVRSTIQYVMTSQTELSHKLELLKETLGEVDRIDHTISGILNLSRPVLLTLVETDLSYVVEGAVKLIRAHVDSLHIEVILDLGLVLPVVGDVGELRQVFLNLLLNACQAMPAGGRLIVSSNSGTDRLEARGVPVAAIQIADTGLGIPADVLNKVYEPFFTTKPGGSGLGLCVCIEIVSRHGGRLDLTCPLSGGTVATVRLPLAG